MKKIFILSVLISFGMICSCQKQDSAAEQQPAQPKAELDAREQSLDERVNALAEKKEKGTTNARTILPDVQGQVLAPAQVEPERDSTIQQLPADARALVADPSQVDSERAEKNRRTQERLAQPEEVQRRSQRKFEQSQKWRTSGAAVSPAVEATSPTPSPTPP